MISGKNHIGHQLSSEGTTTFKTFNPKLNEEAEWNFHEAAIDEVDEAAQLADPAIAVARRRRKDTRRRPSSTRRGASPQNIQTGLPLKGDEPQPQQLLRVSCCFSGSMKTGVLAKR